MRAARFALLALAEIALTASIAGATPSFFVRDPLAIPRRVGGLAVGDLNGDNIDDIAVLSKGSNKLSIVLINPDGTYRQGASIVMTGRLQSIGIGDFNGDDKGDIVVSTATRNVFIVPGNGDGTFGALVRVRRCCRGGGVVVGDFDKSRPNSKYGDDFAISNPGKRQVSILLNANVANAIQFNTERRLRAGKKPVIVGAADFNEDGYADVCALNTRGIGNDVSVLLNIGQNSPGSFRPTSNFFGGRIARSLAIGDVTNDGLVDIVTGDPITRRLTVLPGLGEGVFGVNSGIPISCSLDETTTPRTCYLRALQIADFDQDGHNDLAVLMAGIETARIFSGDDGGGLSNTFSIQRLGEGSRFMLIGNFNGDDLPDLVVGSRNGTTNRAASTVRVLINNSTTGGPIQTRTFTPTGSPPTGGTPTNTPTPPIGGTPTQCRGQGCECDIDDDCNSPFFCATDDGVCCDTPCDIANVSCALPGSVGTCKPINLPIGEECMTDEQCQSDFCVNGFCCNTACDGPFDHCNLNPPGQCMTNSTPNASPTRTPTRTPTTRLKELGEDCGAGSECRSTFCPSEDLVCCENACNGANEQCDLPTQEGQCLPINLPDNEACVVDQQCISRVCEGGLCRGLPTRTPTTPGAATFTPTPPGKQPTGAICTNGDECDSGFCPDGDDVCCNEPCDGPNERCDLPGKEGTCVDIDVEEGGPCELDSQCLSRICEGNICRSAQSRTPTSTRTATPNRQPTLILARGSGGCSVSDGEGSFGSLALLLAFPAGWWFLVRRAPAPVRRRPRRR